MSKRKNGTHTGNALIAFRLNQDVLDALNKINGNSVSEKVKILLIEALKEKCLLRTDFVI